MSIAIMSIAKRGVQNAMEQAKKSLNEQAVSLDADAVIGIRVAPISQNTLIVTGAAVKYS